jgi:hypothetical protein
MEKMAPRSSDSVTEHIRSPLLALYSSVVNYPNFPFLISVFGVVFFFTIFFLKSLVDFYLFFLQFCLLLTCLLTISSCRVL